MENDKRDELLDSIKSVLTFEADNGMLEAYEDQRATVLIKDINNFRKVVNNLLKVKINESEGISFNELAQLLDSKNLNLDIPNLSPILQYSPSPDDPTMPISQYFTPSEESGYLGYSGVNIVTKPLEKRIITQLSPDNYTNGQTLIINADLNNYSGMGDVQIQSIAINNAAEYVITQNDVKNTGETNITLDLTSMSDTKTFGASQLTVSVPLVKHKVFTINANNLGATLTPAGETVALDGTPTSDGYAAIGYREVELQAELTSLSSVEIENKARAGGGAKTPGGLNIGYDVAQIPNISYTLNNDSGLCTLEQSDGDDDEVAQWTADVSASITLNKTVIPTSQSASQYTTIKQLYPENIASSDIFNYQAIKSVPTPIYRFTMSANDQSNLVGTYDLEATSPRYFAVNTFKDAQAALGQLLIPQIPIKSVTIAATADHVDTYTWQNETYAQSININTLIHNINCKQPAHCELKNDLKVVKDIYIDLARKTQIIEKEISFTDLSGTQATHIFITPTQDKNLFIGTADTAPWSEEDGQFSYSSACGSATFLCNGVHLTIEAPPKPPPAISIKFHNSAISSVAVGKNAFIYTEEGKDISLFSGMVVSVSSVYEKDYGWDTVDYTAPDSGVRQLDNLLYYTTNNPVYSDITTHFNNLLKDTAVEVKLDDLIGRGNLLTKEDADTDNDGPHDFTIKVAPYVDRDLTDQLLIGLSKGDGNDKAWRIFGTAYRCTESSLGSKVTTNSADDISADKVYFEGIFKPNSNVQIYETITYGDSTFDMVPFSRLTFVKQDDGNKTDTIKFTHFATISVSKTSNERRTLAKDFKLDSPTFWSDFINTFNGGTMTMDCYVVESDYYSLKN